MIFNPTLIIKARQLATGADIHDVEKWIKFYEWHNDKIGNCKSPESERANKECLLGMHQALVDYIKEKS